MRVVFMGTPDIAATCLRRLIGEKFDLAGVYTKPDKPKNRGMKLEMSEVKKVALEAGLPVFQPTTFKDDAVVEELRTLQPDVIAVVAPAGAGHPTPGLRQHPRQHPAAVARLRAGPVGHPQRPG